MADLLVALGLVLVIEGLMWAGFPGSMQQAALRLAEVPAVTLRVGGLAAMVAGVVIVWWMRS